jgi:hypothetical protein
VDDRVIGDVSSLSFSILLMSRAPGVFRFRDPAHAFFDATLRSHVSYVNEIKKKTATSTALNIGQKKMDDTMIQSQNT